jgi:hypothetical protein
MLDHQNHYDICYDSMASIHKDPRGKSPFFYCAFTLPNGKRCFKSTKLKDRNAAMEFCLRMEGAARKAAARNFSEEQARKILNEIRELSGDSAIRFKSLAAYAAEWLQSKQVTLSEGTFVRYKGFVNDFVANVGKQRAGASIEAITAQDVKAFRDLQVKEGKSETTAQNAAQLVQRCPSRGFDIHKSRGGGQDIRSGKGSARRVHTRAALRARGEGIDRMENGDPARVLLWLTTQGCSHPLLGQCEF